MSFTAKFPAAKAALALTNNGAATVSSAPFNGAPDPLPPPYTKSS
jgi:hypothetical protein